MHLLTFQVMLYARFCIADRAGASAGYATADLNGL
jgi:hypothetical protein